MIALLFGDEMKRRRNGKRWIVMLIVLAIALTAVAGVIVYKEQEYRAGTRYYDALRRGDEG